MSSSDSSSDSDSDSSREMPSTTKTEEFKVTIDCVWQETLSGQTSFPLTDLKNMLDQVGLDLPNYKVRTLEEELKCSKRSDGKTLSKVEFEKVSLSVSQSGDSLYSPDEN